MSGWKLVEAVTEDRLNDLSKDASISIEGRANNSRGGRGVSTGGRSSGRGGRGRGGRSGRGSFRSERAYLTHLAVVQILQIFNLDNLCMDTFIRSYMDEEGYVPLALVCSYQNVACVGASYYDVLSKLRDAGEGSKLELDASNETLRLKSGWEMWLMPNAFGGRGLPKYVKQPEHVLEQQQQLYNQQQMQMYGQFGMDGVSYDLNGNPVNSSGSADGNEMPDISNGDETTEHDTTSSLLLDGGEASPLEATISQQQMQLSAMA